MLGKTEGQRRRGQQRMRWLDSITMLMNMNLSKLCEIVEEPGVGYGPWGHKESDMTQGLNNKNNAVVQDKGQIPLCMTYRVAQHLGPA